MYIDDCVLGIDKIMHCQRADRPNDRDQIFGTTPAEMISINELASSRRKSAA